MKWILFALLFVSCGRASLEEYQYEGEGIVRALVQDLEKVESAADLKAQSPKLKKKFSQLTDLMFSVRRHQLKYPEEEVPAKTDLDVSNALKAEFVRIYRIEGCQEIMEEIQRESLHKISLNSEKN